MIKTIVLSSSYVTANAVCEELGINRFAKDVVVAICPPMLYGLVFDGEVEIFETPDFVLNREADYMRELITRARAKTPARP